MTPDDIAARMTGQVVSIRDEEDLEPIFGESGEQGIVVPVYLIGHAVAKVCERGGAGLGEPRQIFGAGQMMAA